MKKFGLLLILLSQYALGEPLPDPTRPPAGFGTEPQPGEVEESGPRLQSVLMPSQGRPMAVISGRPVRLGEKVGDGRLVRLTESEAVISGPRGTQRLRLTPEVEKHPIPAINDKKPSRKTKESP